MDSKIITPNKDNQLYKRIVKELGLEEAGHRSNNVGRVEKLMAKKAQLQLESKRLLKAEKAAKTVLRTRLDTSLAYEKLITRNKTD